MTKWMLAAAIAAAAACSPKQHPKDVEMSPAVQLEIVNDLNPPDLVTITIRSQSGARQMLGSVSPGQTARFKFHPTNASETFTLVFQRLSGGATDTRVSTPFTLANAVGARWTLDSNTMQIFEQ
jgi:hypothetical protein